MYLVSVASMPFPSPSSMSNAMSSSHVVASVTTPSSLKITLPSLPVLACPANTMWRKFCQMAQNLDLRCVLVPAPWVLWPKHVSNPE